MPDPLLIPTAVQWHEIPGSQRRWIWGLPRGRIWYEGHWFDLDAAETVPERREYRWADVVKSLSAWFAEYAPPYLFEHTRNGGAHALVREFRVLTRDEAHRHTLPQPTEEAVWWGLGDFSAEGARRFAEREQKYTSPDLRFNYTGDDGRTWLVAVGEVSGVSVPHLKGPQVPIDDVPAHIALADQQEKTMPDPIQTPGGAPAPEKKDDMQAMDPSARLDTIEATVASHTTLLTKIAAAVGVDASSPATAPAAAPMAAPAPVAPAAAPMSDQALQVVRGSHELLRNDVRAMRLDALLSDALGTKLVTDVHRETLRKIGQREINGLPADKAVGAITLKDLPELSGTIAFLADRPQGTPRDADSSGGATPATVQWKDASPKERADMIKARMKDKGEDFATARKALRAVAS